ncbi:MAG: sulfatase-like hydrolase/transferase [Marinifilum sp.]|jgi:arylsulfatase A|nr:sulfatase-like hydrolase/transferase [Marinifilum sp.]
MKSKITFLLIFALLACFSCSNKHENQDKPNVILIMVDDMGVETLETYGNIENPTPNLNTMASNGIRFDNCISQPLCTPSRVKMMTGKYNYRNYGYFGHLDNNEKTFGHLFQDQGYATCIAGKWQLNGIAYKDKIKDWNDTSRPYKFGFDEYCLWQITNAKAEGERFADPLIIQNGKKLPRNKDGYGPDIFSNYVIDFIKKQKDKPFFVYYPMVLVHDPFVPTPDSKDWADETKRYNDSTVYFKDMVAYTDKIVGKINSTLKELKLEDNTIVIFTADNGTHPRIYSKTSKGVVQGGKGNTINTGIHVPLIASWGKNIKQAFNYNGLIEFSDFYATFADMLGQENQSDGKSFLRILEGKQNVNTRETAFVHYNPKWKPNVTKNKNQFVMTNSYKLYQDGKFFNTQKDPREAHHLSHKTLTTEELAIKSKLEKELSRHPEWNN